MQSLKKNARNCLIATIIAFLPELIMAQDGFNIIFEQNLDEVPLGTYPLESWNSDWINPQFGWTSVRDNVSIEENYLDKRASRYMKCTFPEGTFSTENGMHWQSPIEGEYEELYLSYSIMFKPGDRNGLVKPYTGVTTNSMPMNKAGMILPTEWC